MRDNERFAFWRQRFDARRVGRTKPSGPRRCALVLEASEERIVPDDASAGVNGIDARGLTTPGGTTLDGSGIRIGQVETGRPGKPGFDNPAHSHPDVTPAVVYLRDGSAGANSNTTDENGHAEPVAGVMIANGAADKGVAPNAQLYASASAILNLGSGFLMYDQTLRSMQQVALQGVRAINVSASFDGQGNTNSLLTQGLDWSARAHDVLYVLSRGNKANQGEEQPVIPMDNYNGINVTASAAIRTDGQQVFRQITAFDAFAPDTNGRRLTDLVAPGADIRVPPLGGAAYVAQSGTSLAAPQVTGTVALLQQYAEDRLAAGATHWDGDARRHQVTKVVLMNSADKIKDAGDGNLLGMTKTILKSGGTSNWLNSDARDSADNDPLGRTIPLDNELGTGQLNARRALTQFSPGEFDPPALGPGVPVIGWNYNALHGAQGEVAKYPFAQRLKGGSYVSLTLTWDRTVNLQEFWPGVNGKYDSFESFTSSPLANLDLYLVPKGATNPDPNVGWSSVSTVDNVEHIFYQLPPGDADYEFWVKQTGTTQNIGYAVAWWAVAAPAPPPGQEGDGVWEDLNPNGIQDQGEPGMAGVGVSLYTSTGSLVGTTTTDEYGNYAFQSVTAGTYYAVFSRPSGYNFTIQDACTNDSVDSDADSTGRTGLFTVTSAGNLTIDAGLVPSQYGSIGDYVWYDTNNNGIQDTGESAAPGVSVTLYTSAGSLVASTATDASGHYTFSSVAPGDYLVNFAAPAGYVFSPMGQGGNSTLDSDANSSGTTEPFGLAVGQTKTDVDAGLVASGSIGDFVWVDQNQNGVQDTGELGLVQIEVDLYASNGTLVGSTLTDGTGHYQFDNLNPGTYYVAFLAPPDYVFSPKGQGSDPTRDSDANPATGQTDPFNLTAGQSRTDIDGGLYTTGSSGGTVGDFVWNDTNKDGIQDAGEPGISGVSVSLYTYSGSLVSTTTTDGTGHYLFSQVALGSYYVTFTAPPNYLFSPSWQGTDPTVDSDPNAMGQTDIFDVSPYDQTRTDIDAGLYSSSGSGSGHGGAAPAFLSGSGSGSGSGVGGAMPDTGTAWGQIPGGWVSGSGSGSGSGLARRSAPTAPHADTVLAAVSALLATPPESQASTIIAQPPSSDLARVTDRLPSEPDHPVSVDRAGAGALPRGNDFWAADNFLGALPDPVFARSADALADALAGSWADVRPDDLER